MLEDVTRGLWRMTSPLPVSPTVVRRHGVAGQFPDRRVETPRAIRRAVHENDPRWCTLRPRLLIDHCHALDLARQPEVF
jgi:hypothetical protein